VFGWWWVLAFWSWFGENPGMRDKTTLDIYGHLYEPLDEVAADRLEELVLGVIAHETRTKRASGL
jgi:hypothetical protein